MEPMIYVTVGLAVSFIAFRAWQAGSPSEPPEADQVSARYVGPAEPTSHKPVTEAELLKQLEALTAEKATQRAYEREVERIVEGRSQCVTLPWAGQPAPKG